RDRIIDLFKGKSAPFEKLWVWKNVAVFDDLKWNGAHFALDVAVEPESYSFVFFDRNDDEGVNGQVKAKAVLQKMGSLNEYRIGQCKRFNKGFEFPSRENDLIDHIKTFKSKLADIVAAVKR
ncbi:MAG: hypothetical protein KGJ60_11660, partial [Verrucomicrobiota bacterium]|nr:hypothetical protein [Verrucomicrobiota bacterium]